MLFFLDAIYKSRSQIGYRLGPPGVLIQFSCLHSRSLEFCLSYSGTTVMSLLPSGLDFSLLLSLPLSFRGKSIFSRCIRVSHVCCGDLRRLSETNNIHLQVLHVFVSLLEIGTGVKSTTPSSSLSGLLVVSTTTAFAIMVKDWILFTPVRLVSSMI